ELRRQSLDAIKDLNEVHLKSMGDPEIVTRIASYEMAYRMQFSVPQLMDITKEPKSIHEMYGTEPGKASFANNCLLARRLVAGGGIKPGVTVGQTDEFGYNAIEDPVDVHDLHATILHLMGIDHTKLTYRFQGRDFRLTDVSGNVVKKLLA